ncbi:MAG TPA: FAD-dependent oxidoreductase, partial [Candidatus Binatia bacterium]|nr:FAD-dependent oxidoreductase [Candidatus Binatia bacterium]
RGLLARDALPDVSLGDWLDRHGYGDELRSRYLLPMCAAIWSCSPRDALAFPFPSFARFFDAHGLLQVIDGPKWRHVSGGSRRYAQRLLAGFSARGQLRLGTPVRAVRRTEAAAWVATDTGEERFDAVVSAAHADQALRLLADADEHERALLSPFGAAANEAVLHTDASLMPRRRGAWCAWNFLAPEEGIGAGPVCVSYWMNRLQALPGQVPYIVTLNPWRQPDPDKVLHRVRFEHPVFSRAAMAAQRRLPEIQGKRHVWFAGAWTGFGFHEDGLRSAVEIATVFGCPPPWSVPAPAPHVEPAAPALSPGVEAA